MKKKFLAVVVGCCALAGASIASADSYDVSVGSTTATSNPVPTGSALTTATVSATGVSGYYSSDLSDLTGNSDGSATSGSFTFMADVNSGSISNITFDLSLTGVISDNTSLPLTVPAIMDSYTGPAIAASVTGLSGRSTYEIPDFTYGVYTFTGVSVSIANFDPFETPSVYPTHGVTTDVYFTSNTSGSPRTPVPSALYALPVLLIGMGATKLIRRRRLV